MKKSFLAAVIMIVMLFGSAVASAAENTAPEVKTEDSVNGIRDNEKQEIYNGIKFEGSVTYEFRYDRLDAPNRPVKGYKTLVILNAETNIAKNLDGYFRASYEGFSNAAATSLFKDFGSKSYSGSIDAVGLEFYGRGYRSVLGSQAFTLGATGILYDNTFVGKNALPYALVTTRKSGAFDLSAIIGQTHYPSGPQANLYIMQGTYAKKGGKSSVGAVFARVDYGASTGGHNYYMVNSTYSPVKALTFTAEYLKSDYNQNNTGYALAADYQVDKKNSLRVAAWRVDWNASIFDNQLGYMTTYWADAKGYALTWKHNLAKNTTFTITDYVFSQLHRNGPTIGRNSFRAGVSYSF